MAKVKKKTVAKKSAARRGGSRTALKKKPVAKKAVKKVVVKKKIAPKKKSATKKAPVRRGGSRTAQLKDQAAIVGVGTTEFSKNSGRSELSLACEAVLDALKDAGLKPSDVDGMVTFTMDTNDEIEIARAIGCNDLTFYSRVPHGGGAPTGCIEQ